jgi:hypothetical protein
MPDIFHRVDGQASLYQNVRQVSGSTVQCLQVWHLGQGLNNMKRLLCNAHSLLAHSNLRALMRLIVGILLVASNQLVCATTFESDVQKSPGSLTAAAKTFLTTQSHNKQCQPRFEVEETESKTPGQPVFLALSRDSCSCSPTGNCQFRVLEQSGSSFKIILNVGMVQVFKPLKSFSNGHPDLDLSAHDSAFESTHRTYRFDGHASTDEQAVRIGAIKTKMSQIES